MGFAGGRRAESGAVFIWLTGAALAASLAMIVGIVVLVEELLDLGGERALLGAELEVHGHLRRPGPADRRIIYDT